jgi:hypothetical protein
MIDVNKFIRNSGGKFFTVVFKRNDGTVRRLNGRIGVTKYAKSGVTRDELRRYFVVYDVKNQAYRNVNKEAVISITCEGVTIFNNQLSSAA